MCESQRPPFCFQSKGHSGFTVNYSAMMNKRTARRFHFRSNSRAVPPVFFNSCRSILKINIPSKIFTHFILLKNLFCGLLLFFLLKTFSISLPLNIFAVHKSHKTFAQYCNALKVICYWTWTSCSLLHSQRSIIFSRIQLWCGESLSTTFVVLGT